MAKTLTYQELYNKLAAMGKKGREEAGDIKAFSFTYDKDTTVIITDFQVVGFNTDGGRSPDDIEYGKPYLLADIIS